MCPTPFQRAVLRAADDRRLGIREGPNKTFGQHFSVEGMLCPFNRCAPVRTDDWFLGEPTLIPSWQMLTEGVDGAQFDPHWPSRTTRLHEGTYSHRTWRIATQWRAAGKHGLSFDTPGERREESWSAPPRLLSSPC